MRRPEPVRAFARRPRIESASAVEYLPALGRDRIAVFGDIHGRADLLGNAQRSLDAQVEADGRRRPIEVYLGDYIDRGPASAQVLAMLLERRRSRPVVCLRGNHEAMMLDALERLDDLPRWLSAGGEATLASYGIRDALSPDALRRALPAEHRAFLASLPVGMRFGSMFFVHAGVRPGVLLEQQRDSDLLWIREPFLSSQRNHGALIVHGHSPVAAIELRHNRINLDTGAVHTGLLTCLLIADDGLQVISG